MRMIRVHRLVALPTLLALGGSAVVFAAPPAVSVDSVPRVSVSYAGLDLSTKVGASTIYGLIRAAAREVCRAFDRRELALRASWEACYEHAVSEAVSTVDQPLVTVLHQQRQHPIATASAETAQARP